MTKQVGNESVQDDTIEDEHTANLRVVSPRKMLLREINSSDETQVCADAPRVFEAKRSAARDHLMVL
jgi:hypothetical protein